MMRLALRAIAGGGLVAMAIALGGRGTASAPAPDAPLVAVSAPPPIASAVAVAVTTPPVAVTATPAAPRVVGPVPSAWASAPRMLADAAPAPGNAAVAALLLDEGSGAILYEQAGHAPLPPASLTKVATAILAIERGDLDALVTTDVDSRVMRGSTVMGLVPGDQFTLRDLVYGLMLPSGNDAALAIGRAVSGSDSSFVVEMNRLAARLGLNETRFTNAHGLNAFGHSASAYDLALLARYAMTLPEFRTVVTTTAWTAQGSRPIVLTNVINDVLYSVPGADGVKSGFTRQAGRTLIASASRDGHRLYAVVLNDTQRAADVAALLDWGFASFDWGAGDSVARPQGEG